MNKKHKQWLVGSIINILYISFLISFILFTTGKVHWRIPVFLFAIVLVSIPIMKQVLGSDAIYGSAWQEEGFKSMRTWLAGSQSFLAKLSRFSFVFAAVMFIVSLIFMVLVR